MTNKDMVPIAAARYSRILDEVRETGKWDCDTRNMWDLYLMLSHRYYAKDESIIPDSAFDTLCRLLLAAGRPDNARSISLWDESALSAGTGFHTVNKLHPLTADIAEALR